MKRFLGKKISSKDDDGSKGSMGSQSDNPYAQTAADPYTEDNTKFAGQTTLAASPLTTTTAADFEPLGMTRYQQAQANNNDGHRPQQNLGRNDSMSSSATAPPPYADQEPPSGYGNNRYGASGGYGNSKYAGSSYSNAPRQGGYGGLGRTESASTVRQPQSPSWMRRRIHEVLT